MRLDGILRKSQRLGDLGDAARLHQCEQNPRLAGRELKMPRDGFHQGRMREFGLVDKHSGVGADLPAYAEQALPGATTFALAYGAKSVTDPRSELGIRTDKSFALSNAILTLRSRLTWAHDYNPDRSIAAAFQTLPGASFVVNGAAQTPDSALTTASAEIRWMNGWSAAATFEGEFSGVSESYAGKGVARYSW